jgi:predicted nucleic acid-binding protein
VQPILFDTSLYINALRKGDAGVVALPQLVPDAQLWVSAVVLEELYAGINDRDRSAIERLEQDMSKIRRVLVPNQSDWVQTGKALAGLGAKYHYEAIGRGRLTNDALIATSCGRVGIQVLTANAGDFSKLAEFCAFQWVVTSV